VWKLNKKYYPIILGLSAIILSSAFFVSGAITTFVTLQNSGQIVTNVTAKSGSAIDIQSAVDVVGAAGGGNVYLPEGTFNFVNVGQAWHTVTVPAGVNIYGAATQRDSNGQVITWKTILVMPYEVPTSGADDQPVFFLVKLNQNDPNKTFRMSDIQLIGYRYYNHSSKTQYIGVEIYDAPWSSTPPTAGMQNIRIDHNNFQDMCGSAIYMQPDDGSQHNRRPVSGVIDHNRIVNSFGAGYGSPDEWADRTLTYGVALGRWASDVWDNNVANVLGKYTNYTIIIENNFFSKWRHDVSSNHGIHYVFRNNIVDGDYGQGSIDAHGSYADSKYPYAVGTRAIEVYNNTFMNPDKTWESNPIAIMQRGGAAVIFNNTLIGYGRLVQMSEDGGNYAPYVPQCHINQAYIWNNTINGAQLVNIGGDEVQNTNFFLRAPTLALDGFSYIPYIYPAPLTQST
jgi:hypothetical protein